MKNISFIFILVLLYSPIYSQTWEEFNKKGAIKYDSEDYKGAIIEYSKALEIQPNAEAFFFRGRSRQILEDYTGAIIDFTKVLEIIPGFAEAYHQRGNVKFFLEDYRGAILDLTKAIDFDPTSQTYTTRGTCKNVLKDYRGAILDFDLAIKMDGNNSIAFFNRALAKIYLGQKDSGCLDFSRAGELGHPNAYEAISTICQ